jgi:hypothetical protein
LYNPAPAAETVEGVMDMEMTIPQEHESFLERDFPDLRLQPERRLCSLYDPCGIAMFSVTDAGEMGVCVRDNFCEEHMM